MSFNYYTPFTIKASQITGTLTDFVVTVKATDNRFKFGGGGHVLNSSGFDLRAYASDGTTAYTYQLIYFDGTTGTFEMKVKVTSAAVGTIIRIYYGDAGLSSDGSSTSTWPSDVLAAYTFGDGLVLDLTDKTSNGSNLTNNNSTQPTTGLNIGGVDFERDNVNFLSRANWRNNPPAVSVGCWLNLESISIDQYFVTSSDNLTTSYIIIACDSGNHPIYRVLGNADITLTSTSTVSGSTWFHLGMSYDSSSGIDGYLNGAADGHLGPNGIIPNVLANLGIGTAIWDSVSVPTDGKMDDVVIYNTKKSADWMQALANTGNVSSFLDTGTEVDNSAASIVLMGDGLSE